MTTEIKRIFLGFSLNNSQTQTIINIQNQLPKQLRLVPSANLHMTLAFLGRATTNQIADLITQVSALHKPKFSVHLNTISHWQKPKILCLNGQAKDQGLLQLAADAQEIAALLNLHCSEHNYTPHITLTRKAKEQVSGIEYQAIELSPVELQLFESYPGINGVEYPTLHRWPLG